MSCNEGELAKNLEELNKTKTMLNGIEKAMKLISPSELDKLDLLNNTQQTHTLSEDTASIALSREKVLANAGKNIEAGCISVPKIM